jgi:hypothetical protein
MPEGKAAVLEGGATLRGEVRLSCLRMSRARDPHHRNLAAGDDHVFNERLIRLGYEALY